MMMIFNDENGDCDSDSGSSSDDESIFQKDVCQIGSRKST